MNHSDHESSGTDTGETIPLTNPTNRKILKNESLHALFNDHTRISYTTIICIILAVCLCLGLFITFSSYQPAVAVRDVLRSSYTSQFPPMENTPNIHDVPLILIVNPDVTINKDTTDNNIDSDETNENINKNSDHEEDSSITVHIYPTPHH